MDPSNGTERIVSLHRFGFRNAVLGPCSPMMGRLFGFSVIRSSLGHVPVKKAYVLLGMAKPSFGDGPS